MKTIENINRIYKGLCAATLFSLLLTACGGGSVSGYGDKGNGTSGTSAGALVATAAPFGATYKSGQPVTLTANKPVATFYYTTDNSTPNTTTSTQLSSGATINISATTTLKVLAKGTDGALSAVITEVYTIDTTLPTVAASPIGSTTLFAEAQYIKLTATDASTTTIYYTTDGNTPTTSSKIYTNPIDTGISNTFTLKFFGQDIVGNESAVASHVYTIGSTITDIKVVGTSSSTQNNVPITFGHVFKVGELASGSSVAGTGLLSGSIPLQVNVKATHGDGSVRHAIISAVLPNLGSGEALAETISFTKAAMGSTAGLTPATLLTAGFSASVAITIGTVTYSSPSMNTLLAGSYTQWLSGPIANEWIVSTPLYNGLTAHPHLTAKFAIRSFTTDNNTNAANNKTKVDVTVENNKTFTPHAQNFTYNYQIHVGGAMVDSSTTALEHFHHARWHKSFWWNSLIPPQVHLKHNIDYLIATKAVPNYDRSVVPTESALASLVTQLTPDKIGPMKAGLVLPYMPATGGRIDIGPLPGWYALYLLSMDRRAKEVMLHIADGSGSWPIHYRDETDPNASPVRVDKTGTSANGADYRDLTSHGNLAHAGPLPVPRCAGGSATLCVTNTTPGDSATELVPDTAHQPSLAYLPYLVTGDYFYLEELHFWAAWNPLGTDASYRQHEKGLLQWDQLRAQGWGLRTLGQAAYITPTSHPLKNYLNTMVNDNLAYYNGLYTTNGSANLLGIVNSHITYPTSKGSDTGHPAWMDDFFTWSIGYLAELGFSNAQGLLLWKAKYPVGRMVDSSYCWVSGAPYTLTVRSSASLPIYSTLGEAYQATFSDIGTDGTKLTEKACGSQAMADWIKTNTEFKYLLAGEMTGYSTYEAGYPSNMQPALAVAATSGISNGGAAWIKFTQRTAKPDYRIGPQFAIVPRN